MYRFLFCAKTTELFCFVPIERYLLNLVRVSSNIFEKVFWRIFGIYFRVRESIFIGCDHRSPVLVGHSYFRVRSGLVARCGLVGLRSSIIVSFKRRSMALVLFETGFHSGERVRDHRGRSFELESGLESANRFLDGYCEGLSRAPNAFLVVCASYLHLVSARWTPQSRLSPLSTPQGVAPRLLDSQYLA